MRFTTLSLASALLVALGLGCSSHSAHTGGGKDGAVGAIDGGLSGIDGSLRLDVRDAKTLDSSVGEAGAVRDGKDGGVDVQARDTQDGRSDANDARALDGFVDSNRDASLDGPRDTSADGKRDGKLDTNQQPDAAVDTAPMGGTCASPIQVSLSPSASHANLSVSTLGAPHAVDFPCAGNGWDIVFEITALQPTMVYADTFGTAWNTALFFSDACDSPTPPAGDGVITCNDDACGTPQSQVFATLGYGYHYLIVSGVNGESGDVTVHLQYAPVGNGPLATLPVGTGTVAGTTGGIDGTRTCDTSGPKNSYWWVSCPSDPGGSFHASSCHGADWDTFLILQVPQQDSVSCNDDDQSCGMQSTVNTTIPPGQGVFVLTVAGYLLKYSGNYTLTYTRP